MKRVLLILSCFYLIMAGTFAQKNLSNVQKTFQNNILNFLKEESGEISSPTVNNDSEIEFKDSRGERHLIRILPGSPFFVILSREGYAIGGSRGLALNETLLAANQVNARMEVVKLICTERNQNRNLVFNIEQYFQTAEDFKYVFFRNLTLLENAEKNFLDEYNKQKR